MKKYILSLLLSCVFYTTVAAEPMIVRRVLDGDTIEVINSDNGFEKIRLFGIDAPEKKGNQPMWEESKTYLESIVMTNPNLVDVKKMNTDRYGRTVGIIFVNDINVNKKLLEKGFAVYYKDYCKHYDYCPDFERTEATAKRHKEGMWSLDSFILPSEWRKQKKAN